MYILIATLQTIISELLIKVGERGKWYWTYTGIFVLLFLTYFALIRMLRDQHLSNKFLSDNNHNFIFSRLFFSIIVALAIIFLRLPGLSFLGLNVDESGWIAGANTFLQDPRPWLAVDGGTGGPLTMFPLLLIKLFGGSINYGTVKLFAILIWVANSLLLYYTFINLFGDKIARLLILPLVASVATFTYHDYLAYNGEHFPLFLISLSFFLYSKITCTYHARENFYAFLLGFVLGCVPYSKLQATPIALSIAFCSVVFIPKKHVPYLIMGGIAFPMLISAYLLIVNNFDNFLNSYNINNISYATRVDKISFSEIFYLFLNYYCTGYPSASDYSNFCNTSIRYHIIPSKKNYY
jgi:hypothetical protein